MAFVLLNFDLANDESASTKEFTQAAFMKMKRHGVKKEQEKMYRK